MRKLLSLFAVLCLWVSSLAAQKDPTSRSWNQPVEPFRIAGNLYYVGASDITSFLITTPEGHILLDGGFEETAPLIRAGVEKLGFRLKDVKILLNNHAHSDHAGGLAALQKLTGAKLAASAGDAPLLARGGKDDPVLGDTMTFPPVRADRILHDGDTVALGGTTLTAHNTPGHTPGATTWTMTVEEGGKRYDVVFAASTSVLSKTALTGNAKYPTAAADYAHTFEVLKKLPCDIFLSGHGSFFDLKGKAERLRKGETPNPFLDAKGYQAWVARNEAAFLTARSAPPPAPSAAH